MISAEELGQTCALIGAQSGDEGKGKLADALSDEFDVIARACGGPETSHRTVVDGIEHTFRMLPSGSLSDDTIVVLGSGMSIHPPTLLDEISVLQDRGFDILPRLYISPSAHILCTHHRELDETGDGVWNGKHTDVLEQEMGVMPCAVHKVMKIGLRMEHLRLEDDGIRRILELQKRSVERMSNGAITVDIEQEMHHLRAARSLFSKRLMLNVAELLSMFVQDGKRVLIEGARATFLDLDHGNYPHVASSGATLAATMQGLGMAPRLLDTCVGVCKPYCTRTDNGPFPSEADDATSRDMLEKTQEWRDDINLRFGWLSIPDLRYSAMVNGFDCLCLSKLDVLDGLEEIAVCTHIDGDGQPALERFSGWKSSTRGRRNWDDVPPEAQELVSFIERQVGVPIRFVGTGPDREDIIAKE